MPDDKTEIAHLYTLQGAEWHAERCRLGLPYQPAPLTDAEVRQILLEQRLINMRLKYRNAKQRRLHDA